MVLGFIFFMQPYGGVMVHVFVPNSSSARTCTKNSQAVTKLMQTELNFIRVMREPCVVVEPPSDQM